MWFGTKTAANVCCVCKVLCHVSWFLRSVLNLCHFVNRTCGLRGPHMPQHTNFLASCAGLKSSQSPQWVWRACVPGRPPNQMRICSLAQRQSIWFVHLSCIDSRVDAGVPLPRLTTGHVLSLPEGPHWFTEHSSKPVSTENSYTAQTQLEDSSELTHCWFSCNRITWIALLEKPVDERMVWLQQMTSVFTVALGMGALPLHPT